MDKKEIRAIFEQALKLSSEKARQYLWEKIGPRIDVHQAIKKATDEDEKLSKLLDEVVAHARKGLKISCSECGKCH